ncbi:MAG: hypothetical protein WA634_13050 [Silvibacterium sp.]
MISPLRQAFNARFRPEDYRHLLQNLDACTRTRVGFRIAETPVFFPAELLDSMACIGADLTHSLLANPDYLAASAKAIPESVHAAAETPHPHFMTADFGLVRAADGAFQPMLVELQAFPSISAFQFVLAENYRSVYSLDASLQYFLGDYTEATFWKKLEQIILRGHHPENVVLLEIDPLHQKTLPDFNITADRLGIRILDITEVVPEDRPGGPPRLCYRNGSRLVPIHRIYNRVVPEELVQKHLELPFDLREPFDVEWAGHPNWYYRLSKFSLPYLDHPAVPSAVFLDEWFAGKGRDRIPDDRNQWVLKPLFSFAGQGIRFAPTEEDLSAIPPAQRRNYLLQQRIDFARVIETPCGPTQPEVRILYLWPDGGQLEPVLSLVRLGRGQMMGVTHTQHQEWAGVSAAFSPRRECSSTA